MTTNLKGSSVYGLQTVPPNYSTAKGFGPVAFTFTADNAGYRWVLGSSTGVSVTKRGDNYDDDFDPADYDGDGKTDFAV